jgi:hypothetical protein
MATNTLTRTESSNELFIYRHTQASGSVESSVTTLTAPVTGYNNPFNDLSGQWRILNLRIEAGNYDAILEFGFKNNDNNKALSAICGFTVGQPPLYATDVNTISKSIAYGFINNPFTISDGLYIIHENTLVQVSGTVDIAALRIVVKDGTVSYYSGSSLLLSSIMSISLCPLYVVAALGFAGNQVTNIGISGASGYTLPTPDYTKELYFLCNGLTSTAPRYPGRLANSSIATHSLTYLAVRTSATFTISYPDQDVQVPGSGSTPTNYYVLPKNYSAVPFVVKLTFPSLASLVGLQFVNGAIGAASSLIRSINALTGLTELEIRGSTERRTLGKNIFPLSLENLYLHGNHDISASLNVMPSLKTLRYLEQSGNSTSSNLELMAFPNLQLLEIPESLQWEASNFESLQNFRLMFNPTRSTSTHGFYGSALSTGPNYLTVITNLAIAQQSATLLYGWTAQSSGNNSYISFLSSYASRISGFNFNPSRVGGGDTINVSGSTITLAISSSANITSETDEFLVVNQPILLKKTDNTSKQLRRISSVTRTGTTYTIAVDRIKTEVTCSQVTITAGLNNTFVLTGISITSNITNIQVRDTVRISPITLPLSSTPTPTPSIVVSKTSTSVTILKGNTNDGITALSNITVIFDYEFSTSNYGTTVTSPGTANETHLSTGTRAIYNYLI